MSTIETLMDIWERTIGNTPLRQQFELWTVDTTLQIVKEAILATARKNLNVRGNLPQSERIRFCSSVIEIRTRRAAQRGERQ